MILSCLLNQKLYVLSYSSKLNNVICDLSLLHECHMISNLKDNIYIDATDFSFPTLDKKQLEYYNNPFCKLDNYLSVNY